MIDLTCTSLKQNMASSEVQYFKVNIGYINSFILITTAINKLYVYFSMARLDHMSVMIIGGMFSYSFPLSPSLSVSSSEP